MERVRIEKFPGSTAVLKYDWPGLYSQFSVCLTILQLRTIFHLLHQMLSFLNTVQCAHSILFKVNLFNIPIFSQYFQALSFLFSCLILFFPTFASYKGSKKVINIGKWNIWKWEEERVNIQFRYYLKILYTFNIEEFHKF